MRALIAAAVAALCLAQEAGTPPELVFRGGVDLVTITATVTDADGHFVPGLTRSDFTVLEDGAPQAVTHFAAERVPVSLGIVLDTSASMAGEKMTRAREALERFTGALLDRRDEVFLTRFGDTPVTVGGWTHDATQVMHSLGAVTPRGGTALYDAVATAVPMAAAGQYRKRAIVLISDGQDTSSRTGARQARDLILDTDVVVFAIGLDASRSGAEAMEPPVARRPPAGPRSPAPLEPPRWPIPDPAGVPTRPVSVRRADVTALRALTDASGGRTEIISQASDLGPATAAIAAELNQQYLLAYPSPARHDGRWHAIRVVMRKPAWHVRARHGYLAF